MAPLFAIPVWFGPAWVAEDRRGPGLDWITAHRPMPSMCSRSEAQDMEAKDNGPPQCQDTNKASTVTDTCTVSSLHSLPTWLGPSWIATERHGRELPWMHRDHSSDPRDNCAIVKEVQMDGGDMEQCDMWDMLAIATHEQLAWTVGPLAKAMEWLQTGVDTNTTRVKKANPKGPSSRRKRLRPCVSRWSLSTRTVPSGILARVALGASWVRRLVVWRWRLASRTADAHTARYARSFEQSV